MRKLAIIASLLTGVHLLEDLLWVILGRYTDVPFWIVVLAIIGMGIAGGIFVRKPKIMRFLGK